MKTITNEIKAKYFSPYVGVANIYNKHGIKSTLSYSMLDDYFTTYFDTAYIELTPLEHISDEDAIEISKIWYGENQFNAYPENHTIWKRSTKTMAKNNPSRLNIRIYQYLQSKGYALPYLDYSVDDLVELNVIKLKK